ncbi:MAG: hypothetical protein ACI4U5_03165 [Bacilli bacterium]
MKRKILILVAMLFSFSSCSSKKINMLLGYPLDVNCSSLFTSFSYEKMNIASLYELICKDGELLNTKKKISSYIKNSQKIVLNIGLYDVLSFVKIIDGKVDYLSSTLEEKMELYSYYFFKTIDLIYEINKKVDLLVLGIYNPLLIEESAKLDEIISSINNDEQEILSSYPFKYYVNYKLSSYLDSSFTLNEEGKKIYISSIDSFINEAS